MKWFLYNLLLALGGLWLLEYYVDLPLERPLWFLGVYTAIFLAIWLSSYVFNRRYFFKFPMLVGFIGFIIYELFESNFRVAWDVLTIVHKMNPAIIAIPLDCDTDREIVTLATLITFTPGTLSLKVSDDRKTLFVHEMYIPNDDVEAVRRKIKDGFERRLLQLTR